jgi:hypothetical protein
MLMFSVASGLWFRRFMVQGLVFSLQFLVLSTDDPNTSFSRRRTSPPSARLHRKRGMMTTTMARRPRSEETKPRP